MTANSSRALTPRQQQILELIRSTIERSGIPPTRAEIARALGFRSTNAAEDHLRALARKGVIELSSGTSRGIRLLQRQHESMPIGAPRPSGAERSADGPRRNAGHSALILPLVGRVAAGSPILAAEHITRQVRVDPSLFAQKPDYLLTVRGLSMRDAGILEGDLLAVRKSAEARNGQIVVARLGDDVTVKRFRRVGRTIELLPENPEFEPITVTPEDEFAIEGIAVGLIRTANLG